jgi:hypothetical protein
MNARIGVIQLFNQICERSLPFQIGNIYLLAPNERKSVKKWISKQLLKGYIHPSKSPVATPFFFVKKHDGGLCPCMDYRALNAVTVKNRYPIPRISDLIDSLSQASIFTKN